MPAPSPRSPRDLDTVPAFLRERRPEGRAAIPRPSTPPAAEPERQPRLDPATLPMPSLSRRRVITLAGVLAASLLTLGFVRQVGEASAASDRADGLRAQNAALHDEVAGLQSDLTRVQDPRFITLQGRGFGLGGPGEIPFALSPGAPSLGPDAPGSAAVRLGAPAKVSGPLDAWLDVLFGPTG
jgi:hypothetical protein